MLLIEGRDRWVPYHGRWLGEWVTFHGAFEDMKAFRARVAYDKRRGMETVFVRVVKELPLDFVLHSPTAKETV